MKENLEIYPEFPKMGQGPFRFWKWRSREGTVLKYRTQYRYYLPNFVLCFTTFPCAFLHQYIILYDGLTVSINIWHLTLLKMTWAILNNENASKALRRMLLKLRTITRNKRRLKRNTSHFFLQPNQKRRALIAQV